MKNRQKIKYMYWRLVVVVVLLLIGSIVFIKFTTPYYEIEDRVEKRKAFEGINKEKAIGWLRIQGTNIDFPIVHYDSTDVSDPTYELGWSFSYYNELQKKTTIFSHNVLNVSSKPVVGDKNHRRFEQLMAFIYYDFVKENKYIQYTTGNENYLFKIYGVSFQKESKIDSYDKKKDKSSVKKYIRNTKEKSYFDFDVDVDENDKLLTLITCTRFFGPTTEYSFVIDARMVRNNEVISNYNVKEKESYNKIKKIMEGDVENA